jgi:lipoprotein-anchoring transpeptidase ErfK/SrfK
MDWYQSISPESRAARPPLPTEARDTFARGRVAGGVVVVMLLAGLVALLLVGSPRRFRYESDVLQMSATVSTAPAVVAPTTTTTGLVPSQPYPGNLPLPAELSSSSPSVAGLAPMRMVATTLKSVASVTVYTRATTASPVFMTLSSPNVEGYPQVFLVLARQPGWLYVRLPVRPNEGTGWIQASQVTLAPNTYRVIVQLDRHELWLFHNGSVEATFPVAVGKPAAPTPTGRYYVIEGFDTSHTYENGQLVFGPYAFGTSDYSDTYTYFTGGPAEVGIHGTNEPWVIGHSASHGCVRLFDADIVKLAGMMPVGTPVDIVP